MSISYIGPINVTVLEGDARWTGQATAYTRDATLSGFLEGDGKVQQVQELVNKPPRDCQSYAGIEGVLEPIWTSGGLEDFRGWYLLRSVEFGAEIQHLIGKVYPFTLQATYCNQIEPVIARSARARSNDFSLTAKSLVVQPFWGEDSTGEPFVTDPGGTAFAREYDPRTDYDPASPTTTGRSLRLHSGTVT